MMPQWNVPPLDAPIWFVYPPLTWRERVALAIETEYTWAVYMRSRWRRAVYALPMLLVAPWRRRPR
jgi:hypothetical protein